MLYAAGHGQMCSLAEEVCNQSPAHLKITALCSPFYTEMAQYHHNEDPSLCKPFYTSDEQRFVNDGTT